MPERNDYPSTIRNPSLKKNGANGHSQFKPSTSSVDKKTESITNGDRPPIVNFNSKNGQPNEIGSDPSLQAPKSVLQKQTRELQEKNKNAFGGVSPDESSLEPKLEGRGVVFASKSVTENQQKIKNQAEADKSLRNFELPAVQTKTVELISKVSVKTSEIAQNVGNEAKDAGLEIYDTLKAAFLPASYADQQKENKKLKADEKDNKIINGDRWLLRNGHTMTYVGLFLFTLTLLFRPYEWVPGFASFTSITLVFAIATLLFYVPSQLSTEGNLTILTTEVKCILFLAFWAILTMPIAKDPGLAWKVYNEVYIKIVLIFVIMVNTLRTPARLKGLMWLSVGIGAMLSFEAIQLSQEGKFAVEGYRVAVDFGGMFANPNDMAIHLVMFMPVAIVLGIASKNKVSKLVYFTTAALMVAGNMVTQSRGGFLGLLAVAAFMVWKLSKQNRLPIILVSLIFGVIVITLAPGNYWMRILSIFIPGLDAVGSSDQRKDLLQLSLLVTARNPFGIGFANFPVVGIKNLQSHNAFTQISSELGWLSFAAYMIFMVSPLRKLMAMERRMFAKRDLSWMYYLSIGIQASIVGYMVSSFFASVAYQWYIYYPIAYAVCLRRLYNQQEDRSSEGLIEEEKSLN